MDGARELEIATLSLDEPELESVLFTDEDNCNVDDDDVVVGGQM